MLCVDMIRLVQGRVDWCRQVAALCGDHCRLVSLYLVLQCRGKLCATTSQEDYYAFE